jgi:hypothetical protein
MIRTDEGLAQTRLALADLEAALASLSRRRGEIHPDRFALMADPLLDHIQRLRDEIDAYIGFAEAKAAVAPLSEGRFAAPPSVPADGQRH